MISLILCYFQICHFFLFVTIFYLKTYLTCKSFKQITVKKMKNLLTLGTFFSFLTALTLFDEKFFECSLKSKHDLWKQIKKQIWAFETFTITCNHTKKNFKWVLSKNVVLSSQIILFPNFILFYPQFLSHISNCHSRTSHLPFIKASNRLHPNKLHSYAKPKSFRIEVILKIFVVFI